jgi:hypothetical protein
VICGACARPTPVAGMTSALLKPECCTAMRPVRAPTTAGRMRALNVQVALGASVAAAQPCASGSKSAGKLVKPLIVTGCTEMLRSVMTWSALASPKTTLPKLSGVGLALRLAPGVPVPFSATFTAGALLTIVSVELRLPLACGSKRISSSQFTPDARTVPHVLRRTGKSLLAGIASELMLTALVPTLLTRTVCTGVAWPVAVVAKLSVVGVAVSKKVAERPLPDKPAVMVVALLVTLSVAVTVGTAVGKNCTVTVQSVLIASDAGQVLPAIVNSAAPAMAGTMVVIGTLPVLRSVNTCVAGKPMPTVPKL